MTTWYDRNKATRHGANWCPWCDGFAYEQLEPGVWSVCRGCCGSAVRGVEGDRRPGEVVRNTRLEENSTSAEKSGLAVKERWAKREPSIQGFR